MIDDSKNESRLEARLEAQLDRLRGRLATAWRDGCSPEVIRRLEAMIDRRWRIRDLGIHKPLQPA